MILLLVMNFGSMILALKLRKRGGGVLNKMREIEFIDKLLDLGICDNKIKVGVYYNFGEDGNVVLDVEEMTQEFERKLEEIKELVK